MSEDIIAVLTPIFVSVIGLLASWGLAELSRFIRSRTDNEIVKGAIATLGEVVETTVRELGQTVKAAGADGKFTAEEKAAIKNQAITHVRSQLPAAVQKNALKAVNDLEKYINSRIERSYAETYKNADSDFNLSKGG